MQATVSGLQDATGANTLAHYLGGKCLTTLIPVVVAVVKNTGRCNRCRRRNRRDSHKVHRGGERSLRRRRLESAGRSWDILLYQLANHIRRRHRWARERSSALAVFPAREEILSFQRALHPVDSAYIARSLRLAARSRRCGGRGSDHDSSLDDWNRSGLQIGCICNL